MLVLVGVVVVDEDRVLELDGLLLTCWPPPPPPPLVSSPPVPQGSVIVDWTEPMETVVTV